LGRWASGQGTPAFQSGPDNVLTLLIFTDLWNIIQSKSVNALNQIFAERELSDASLERILRDRTLQVCAFGPRKKATLLEM
jgi:hypothetical protein